MTHMLDLEAVNQEAAHENSVNQPDTAQHTMHGPLTHVQNRVMVTSRARVPGTLRIAMVGDSMLYGAGLPVKKALAARLAAHLNGALPDTWVECLSFGVPGACAFHGVGRVVTQALPLDPDIVVLCLTDNDAMMLRGQPDTPEALGEQWLAFQPLLLTGLKAFRALTTARGRRAVVLYHDGFRDAAGLCLPDVLKQLCAEADVPFLDGSAVLTGYPQEQLWVSPVDRHINAFATDAIARHLAQYLVAQKWLPASTGFSDGDWIEAIESGAEARINGGLAPVFAYAEALAMLDGKWMHRRNTGRRQFEARYQASRGRLLGGQRAALTRLALAGLGRRLRTELPLARLTMPEQWTYEVMGLSYAFEHLIASGELGQTLEGLDRVLGEVPAEHVSATDGVARFARLSQLTRTVIDHLAAARLHGDDARQDCADTHFLRFWASRMGQWCTAVELCAARFVDLFSRLPEDASPDTVRLVSHAGAVAGALMTVMEKAAEPAALILKIRDAAGRAAGAGWLTVELVIATPPGEGTWTFNVGIESAIPGLTERHIACGYLIRDGQPHRYEFELPLMLAGDLHMSLHGNGVSSPGALRLHESRVRWPHGGLPDVPLPAPQVELKLENFVSFAFRNITTLRVG